MPFGLLDHLQLGSLGRSAPGSARTGPRRGRRRRVGGIRVRIALGKDHSLSGLARVDAEHGAHRNRHELRDTAEARLEGHDVVAELQSVRRIEADVEHDLAVLDVLARHLHAVRGGVDDDVRRLTAVGDPFVQGAQQIRPSRLQWRISRSGGVSDRRNAGRAKMAFMYFTIGWACAGSSMPKCPRRQRIGAMLASTSENSSLRKNGFALNTSALAQIASHSTLRLWAAVLLVGSASMSRASPYQSRSMR